MARVIASIEARMRSSRLPGKVLADVCGKPALTRLIRRLQKCRKLDNVVLATSVLPEDDILEQWALHEGVACHRGSEEDVLLRVVEAHRKMKTDIVVEVTGDCTLLDPEIIDFGITTFFENECDVVTNVRKSSFPMGIDIQVFRFSDLAEVERTVFDPAVREHVSLYFYEHPETYRIIHLVAPLRWHAPDCRLQLDYPEDLKLITAIYRELEPLYGEVFGIEEIMNLLKQKPELLNFNRACREKAAR